MAEKLASNELTLSPEPAGAEAGAVGGTGVAGTGVTAGGAVGAAVGAWGEGVALGELHAAATIVSVASATM